MKKVIVLGGLMFVGLVLVGVLIKSQVVYSRFNMMVLDPKPVAPVATPQMEKQESLGKIDMDAICDGALAYMTFEDSAKADVFVADCKVGKHPEVVEQYLKNMNLDGAELKKQ
ncbi:MAG: hypothetical protein WAT81_04805 [Candidatus Moraniibacteriota bacterium]